MKQILVIGPKGGSQNPEAYYAKYQDFFTQALNHSNNEGNVFITFLDDLLLSVGDGEFKITDTASGKSLNEFTAIIIRGTGLRQKVDFLRAISSYCHLNNIKLINDYHYVYNSSKLAQAAQFHENNLPVSTTCVANQAFIKLHQQTNLQFPFILKAVFGSHGADNYLVKTVDEVEKIISSQPDTIYVAQRFVPNDGDFRILIIGDEVMVIGRHATGDSHLNNTSQGGTAKIIDPANLPDGLIKDAKKIAKLKDMTIAGVDAIIDRNTGQYFFLEVNSQPQLMSGAFLEEKTKMVANFFSTLD